MLESKSVFSPEQSLEKALVAPTDGLQITPTLIILDFSETIASTDQETAATAYALAEVLENTLVGVTLLDTGAKVTSIIKLAP